MLIGLYSMFSIALKTMFLSSNASMEQFNGSRRKFLHGVLDKKMATKEVLNKLVVRSDTSSDDEHTGCDLLERHLIEANIKEKMVENALNNMVDKDDMEVPYLLSTIEGGIMDPP